MCNNLNTACLVSWSDFCAPMVLVWCNFHMEMELQSQWLIQLLLMFWFGFQWLVVVWCHSYETLVLLKLECYVKKASLLHLKAMLYGCLEELLMFGLEQFLLLLCHCLKLQLKYQRVSHTFHKAFLAQGKQVGKLQNRLSIDTCSKNKMTDEG